MSTLRTTTLKHGSSTIDNIVFDNQGRSTFGGNALFVNAQNQRVGVNTTSPTVALDVDGAINATGNVVFSGQLNLTGELTVDTNTLFVDATNNRVGIGTNAPASKLHVVGEEIYLSNNGRVEYHLYNLGAVTEWLVGQRSNTDHNLTISKKVGATILPQAVINTAGNVGLGLTSPAQKLHVSQATAGGTTSVLISNPSGAAGSSAAIKLGVTPENNNIAKFGIIHERFNANGRGDTYFCSNFTDDQSDVTDADAVITIQGSTKNVGIQVTNPGFSLDCRGDGRFRSLNNGDDVEVILREVNSGGTVVADYKLRAATDTLQTVRNSSVLTTLTSAGDLGLGTTTPGVKLDVVGTVAIRGAAQLQLFNTANSSGVSIQTDGATNPAEMTFNTGGSESMRLAGGRLLVGTSSPKSVSGEASMFQVAHIQNTSASLTRYFSGAAAAGPVLSLGRSRSATIGGNAIVLNGDCLGRINFSGDDGVDLNSVAAEIKSEVDGTPGTDDMPGRLVFSTTADGASTPTERMRISSNGSVDMYGNLDCFYVRSGAAATTSRVFISGRYSATNTQNGTESFRVFTNGNVENTNNSYTAISDIKLKENIVDASSQWNDIKALRPVNYNFKEGQTHTQLGLIAQEVELVSPGLVSESPDRDEEGNDLGTTTKSVNYSVLYMKAVKALQEAMERIEVLEQRVLE